MKRALGMLILLAMFAGASVACGIYAGGWPAILMMWALVFGTLGLTSLAAWLLSS